MQKIVKTFSEFLNEGKRKPIRKRLNEHSGISKFKSHDYSEVYFMMDKFMRDVDDDLIEEYYDLIDSGNIEELVSFIENYADESALMRYMPRGGTLHGLARYIIAR